MFTEILRFISIFTCTYYVFCKLIKQKTIISTIQILELLISIALSVLACILSIHLPRFTYFIPLLLLWAILCYRLQQPQLVFTALIISFCISFGLFALCSTIALIVVYPLYYKFDFSYGLFATAAVILHCVSTKLLFKIRRFKNGMPFLFKTSTRFITTLFCITLLSFLAFTPIDKSILWLQLLSLILFVFSLAFLIHWWQVQITKSYQQSVMLRNYESLTGELEEAYKKIASLEAQNEEQGRLIHHDNKRLAAMENAIDEYLAVDFDDKEALHAKSEALRIEIQSLSRNRSDTLREIYKAKSRHYNTGIDSLNTLLNYMDKRATEADIQFTVHNALELQHYVPKCISEDELTHLLSDLLENAIIACNGTDNAVVQLQFYESQKHFVIEVADNGIPFEAKSLVNFGLSRLTTHEATGGSGIGLMDIWKIKECCGATLHIEEYKAPSTFTKKISLVFDHKNLYSVKTYRADAITALSKRSDLRIY